MTLTLTINLDNAAFGDEPLDELERIFRTVADEIQAGWYVTPDDLPAVRDHNGNTVGRFEVSA